MVGIVHSGTTRLSAPDSGPARTVTASGEAGFSYVILMILLSVVVVVSLGFLSQIGVGSSASMGRSESIQAEYLAEAAINHAMWMLMNDPTFPNQENQYYMHNLGGGRYGYRVRRHTATTFATIAALGAYGDTVTRRSHVLYIGDPQVPPTQMLTGTYAGDGSSGRAITDVGFEPDFVIIRADDRQVAVGRTSTMVGDQSKSLTSATAVGANQITSLDEYGFSIGSALTVNRDRIDYLWAAFRAVPGAMKVDSYVGDGVDGREILSVGFQPSLVIILPELGQECMLRLDSSVHSFNLADDLPVSGCILSPFLADGFTLGPNDRVNRSGDLYHYVCWSTVSGQQVEQLYTGDGNDNRDITTVGFRPEYAIVKGVTDPYETTQRFGIVPETADLSQSFLATRSAANQIQTFIADGFQVGTDAAVNGSGNDYVYFAWIRK